MSKTYALLDVDNTLLNDNGARNLNIVNSLIKNNIHDVYLFIDMRLQEPSMSEYRSLIGDLQDLGLTVHGVLSTSDLFWAVDHNELTTLDGCMAKNAIRVNNLSDEQLEELKKECPRIGLALEEKRYDAYAKLGAAFLEANIRDISEKSHGAKIAADILSTMLPNRPHPKALLFKHFLNNRPAACTKCVIFEDRKDVINDSIALAQKADVKFDVIQVYPGGFQDKAALQIYNDHLNKLENPHYLNPVPDLKIEEVWGALDDARIKYQYAWLETNAVIQSIQIEYTQKRGYKFFGYSSAKSLDLLDALRLNSVFQKQVKVDEFLSYNENKGTRLYDVLIEQRIRHAQPQSAAQGNNKVWLTKDTVYLITQKYKQNRGFKFFGYSSDESVNLLNILNDDCKSFSHRQMVLEGYLNNEQYKDKRLHGIIIEVKSMIPFAAPPVPRQEKA